MDDWRLNNQINYLFGQKIKKIKFVETDLSDHEHCSFCWEKIGAEKDQLNEGYCTMDGRHWICEVCFEDFKNTFQWHVVNTSNAEEDSLC